MPLQCNEPGCGWNTGNHPTYGARRITISRHCDEPDRFVRTVTALLREIEGREVGRQLLDRLDAAITARQTREAGPYAEIRWRASNICISGGPYNVSLREARIAAQDDPGARGLFHDRLKTTLLLLGYDVDDPVSLRRLVIDLSVVDVPDWNGRRLATLWEGAPTEAARMDRVRLWAAPEPPLRGTAAALPDVDPMDILLIFARAALDPGAGGWAVVGFNPAVRTGYDNRPRPGDVALFHELVHALYTVEGRELAKLNVPENRGARLGELEAVGLGPFAGAPIHENRYRQQRPFRERPTYNAVP